MSSGEPEFLFMKKNVTMRPIGRERRKRRRQQRGDETSTDASQSEDDPGFESYAEAAEFVESLSVSS